MPTSRCGISIEQIREATNIRPRYFAQLATNANRKYGSVSPLVRRTTSLKASCVIQTFRQVLTAFLNGANRTPVRMSNQPSNPTLDMES